MKEKEIDDIITIIRKIYGEGFIPLHAPLFVGNEKKYINECIDTTFVSSVGKFVDRIEEMMAEYTGAARCVACVNGTSALHVGLMMAGVRDGDLVLTQPVSFIATCNAISYCGASPLFIDVDRDTMGMSPEVLRQWLESNTHRTADGSLVENTTGRRIAACVPMHTFGIPCRIDKIAEICTQYNIPLVEDAAESIGSFYKGKHTGTFGDIGCVSFNGNKTITTGGGGMILFRDKELGDRAKHLTTQAKVPHRWEFNHDMIGYNYRMPNINAALGCAQLENLERYVEAKRKVTARYADFFSRQSDIEFMTELPESRANYWFNTILLPGREERDEFLERTNDNGVMTRPLWTLMHRLPMFRDCLRSDLSNSEYLAERAVNIPSGVILDLK